MKQQTAKTVAGVERERERESHNLENGKNILNQGEKCSKNLTPKILTTNRGITIIVLIITIIIILILLGVGTKVAIDSKIFNTAKEAVGETNHKIEQQQSQVDDLMKELDDATLVLSDHIKIGDYVAYQPEEVTESYIVETKYSGADEEQSISQENSLKWRVLTVDNKTRTVELICETPTKATITFKGARGYNNCVYLLNDICKKLYSNSNYGAVARSENIEDIESKMDLSVWDYHDYIDRGVKDGDSIAYKGSYVPKRYLEDVKTGGVSSKQDKPIAYETEEEAYITKPEKLVAVQGGWAQDDMSDKYLKADTRNESEMSTMYNMLLTPKTAHFNLATRCVLAPADWDYIAFLKMYCDYGNVRYWPYVMFKSFMQIETTGENSIRPIVKLSYKHIDLAAGYDEINGWKIK